MINAATTFLTGASTPTSSSNQGTEPACRTAADLSFERELHNYATQRIPIPGNTIHLPADLKGAVSVAFELGGAQICKSAMTPGLPTPSLYADGELTIDAASDTGTHYGPFKYEIPTVSWLPDPSMPAGQQLTTHFAPLSAETSLNVHPSFSPGSGLALTVADAQLHALPFDVTLVKDGQALLQVGLGPTLTIEASISPRSVEQDAEIAKTAEGGDTVAAADDAAQTIADDLGLGIEEIGNEFYGVDLEQAAADFYTQFEPTVAAALEADPALIAFGSPADLVSGDAITAGDAAAVDDAMGAGAVDFSAEDIFFVLVF
jgi:hypothetical protein